MKETVKASLYVKGFGAAVQTTAIKKNFSKKKDWQVEAASQAVRQDRRLLIN